MTATLKTGIVQEPSSSIANLTLSSSGGVTFGAAATTNTITSAAATALTIQSAGTTAMTIDTSQNVGIGTTSPSQTLEVSASNPTRGIIARVSNSAGSSQTGSQLWFNQNGVANWVIGQPSSTDAFAFWNGRTNGGDGTERMRIDSSGNLLVGGTAQAYSSRLEVTHTGLDGITTIFNGTSANNAMKFRNGNGQVGSIITSGSATSFNTSSDYRLKTSILPMTTGLATVAALKPVTYKWKSDDTDGEGFIAHELQAIIPLAVSGEKDALNENGSIKPQGVDYSKIVVHLVAAIQELKATVDAQAAEITALQSKVGA
jgi:hypothetical protein